MPVHLIFAQGANRVIGRQGQLPWHLPEDLGHFKRTTLGQAVIMGRLTWESLPEQFRPLPGRTNIVVTRQTHFQAPHAQTVHSIEEALQLFPPQQTLWVIGGAQLLQSALPIAQKIVLTQLHEVYAGDVWAPAISMQEWGLESQQEHHSATGIAYAIQVFTRRTMAANLDISKG